MRPLKALVVEAVFGHVNDVGDRGRMPVHGWAATVSLRVITARMPHHRNIGPPWNPTAQTFIAAIEEYLDAHNEDPKPFGWTATAESILDKVRRGRAALQQAVNR
jgi:hypothetical protein